MVFLKEVVEDNSYKFRKQIDYFYSMRLIIFINKYFFVHVVALIRWVRNYFYNTRVGSYFIKDLWPRIVKPVQNAIEYYYSIKIVIYMNNTLIPKIKWHFATFIYNSLTTAWRLLKKYTNIIIVYLQGTRLIRFLSPYIARFVMYWFRLPPEYY